MFLAFEAAERARDAAIAVRDLFTTVHSSVTQPSAADFTFLIYL